MVLTTVMPMLCVPTHMGVLFVHVARVILGMEILALVNHACTLIEFIMIEVVGWGINHSKLSVCFFYSNYNSLLLLYLVILVDVTNTVYLCC